MTTKTQHLSIVSSSGERHCQQNQNIQQYYIWFRSYLRFVIVLSRNIHFFFQHLDTVANSFDSRLFLGRTFLLGDLCKSVFFCLEADAVGSISQSASSTRNEQSYWSSKRRESSSRQFKFFRNFRGFQTFTRGWHLTRDTVRYMYVPVQILSLYSFCIYTCDSPILKGGYVRCPRPCSGNVLNGLEKEILKVRIYFPWFWQ